MMASLTTVTVRPEEELVLPHTYTPRGASEAAPGRVGVRVRVRVWVRVRV